MMIKGLLGAALLASATAQNAACPAFRIIHGRGGTSQSSYINANSTAAVTCCSDTLKAGWASPSSRCPVWAERDRGFACQNAVTWYSASATCASVGARLCTDTELIGACGQGTGCQHDDQRRIWSSTFQSTCSLSMNPPTVAPTNTPPTSRAPVTAAPVPYITCPGYKIESGQEGISGVGGEAPRYANPTELHEVTCCSSTQIAGFWAPYVRSTTVNDSSAVATRCPVWAERDGGALTCLSRANWSTAYTFCRAAGARLCTANELQLGCGAHSGCSFNNEMVWSSDPSPSTTCPNQPVAAPVSVAPSMSPTIRDNCPGQKIQSGAGGTGGRRGDVPRFAGLNELHAVTCCSNRYLPGFSAPVNNCPVYAERDAGGLNCNLDVNFAQAAAFCQGVGARLCNATELILGCGAGLGCAANNEMVWSSTSARSNMSGCTIGTAPTFAPTTPAPTLSPTPLNTRCGYLVDCGAAGRCTGGNRYADPSELHELTCCSDTTTNPNVATSGYRSPRGNCTVWAERDAGGLSGCFPNVNYSTGLALCTATNGRLCTRQELRNNCGAGSGCNFDNQVVWSSEQNPQCNNAALTFSPTSAPTTLSPTPVNSCNGYKIVSGRGLADGRQSRYAGATEMHGVTCCSDTPLSGFNPPVANGCPVYSERNADALGGTCLITGTYQQANAFCTGGGARLCSPSELDLRCGVGTGCQHDSRMIWSNEPSPCVGGTFPPTAFPTPLTPSPTGMPTVPQYCNPNTPQIPSTNGRVTVSGRGGPIYRYADPTELHQVTCCADNSIAGFQAPRNRTINGVVTLCSAWAERDAVNGCASDMNWADANTFCNAIQGARLCSDAELMAGCGQGTGCGHDADLIWGTGINPYCNGNTATPTPVPTTNAPTLENYCPGYKIQWGAGGPGGPLGANSQLGNPRYASPLAEHGVTCCSDVQLEGFSNPYQECQVWAERDGATLGECLQPTNYETAFAFCANAGARLCTPLELIQGCGVGLGCAFNAQYVWSNEYNPNCGVAPPTTGWPTFPTSMPTMALPPTTAAPSFPSGSSSSSSSDGNDPALLGIAIVLILVALVAGVGLYVYQKKNSGAGGAGGHAVGFDNPLYAVGGATSGGSSADGAPGKSYAAAEAPEDGGGYVEGPIADAGEQGEDGYMDVDAADDDDEEY